MAYCRILGRDGTPQGIPVLGRRPEPNYVLSRRDECVIEGPPERPPVIVLPSKLALRPHERDKRDIRDIMKLVEEYLAAGGSL